jgi:drug/metabolite transporter (DMT)-like permease
LIFLKESLNRYQVFSVFMALSGMLILSIGDTIGAVHAQIGDIMIIAAMAAYGFGVVIFKKWLSHVDPEVMLFLRYASGVVIVLAISGLLGFSVGPEIAALPSSMIIMLFVFAFFSRFLSLSCFYGALERLPAVTCGFMLSTLPVSGMLFSVVILGEKITTFDLVGVIAIMGAVVLEHAVMNRPIMRHGTVVQISA